MADITIKHIPIETIGYIQCDVPLEIMSMTRQEIDGMIMDNFKKSNPYNECLAGAIQHEYNLLKVVPFLNRFFKVVIPEYWKLQGKFARSKEVYQIIERKSEDIFEIWVNLQQKYELNPLHSHSGVLSFVYWVNIPYTLKDECERPSSKGNTLKHPVFSFYYPSMSGDYIAHYNIDVDKSYEGQMIIFPSSLKHQVTPFYTSNDYRISVAGNLYLVEENG